VTVVDVYEAVTNQIITAIEAGAGQVAMPWHASGAAITRPKKGSDAGECRILR